MIDPKKLVEIYDKEIGRGADHEWALLAVYDFGYDMALDRMNK